jgi:hypothetical protein
MDKRSPHFLSLPTEVRLMIYELLPIPNRHHTLEDSSFESPTPDISTPSEVILVTKSAVFSLLYTCQNIYQEYNPTLDKNSQVLRSEPLRLIVDWTSLNTFVKMENCLASLIESHRESIHSGNVLFFPPPLRLPAAEFAELADLADLIYLSTNTPGTLKLTCNHPLSLQSASILQTQS